MQWQVVLLGLVGFGLSGVFGQSRPNFSGTWKHVSDSDRITVVTIEHREPEFLLIQEVHDTRATSLPRVPLVSASDRQEFRVGGAERAESNDQGRRSWTSVYWEGPALVHQRVVKDGYRVTVTRDSWSLAEGGTTLKKVRRVVTMDGVTEELATFRKQ